MGRGLRGNFGYGGYETHINQPREFRDPKLRMAGDGNQSLVGDWEGV
jgi:hypothetical protein